MIRSRYLLMATLAGALGATACGRRDSRHAEEIVTSTDSGQAAPIERQCAQTSGDALAQCLRNVEAIRNAPGEGLRNAQ
jgi:hypothetical protein